VTSFKRRIGYPAIGLSVGSSKTDVIILPMNFRPGPGFAQNFNREFGPSVRNRTILEPVVDPHLMNFGNLLQIHAPPRAILATRVK
jgi:hypothetical protein